MQIHEDAKKIIAASLAACAPDAAVQRALEGRSFDGGKLRLVAIGKAAWQMAASAEKILGQQLESGIVITKYGHSRGPIPRCRICEAGHPVPDENSFAAARAATDLVADLGARDQVIFLVSGGGSALFELPVIDSGELSGITRQLLSSGADIVEMNTIRKRLSAVKGGRFAELCAPAKVFSIVLSDIIGDPLDMIASGPAYPDSSTCADARAIAKKYALTLSPRARAALDRETPKQLNNVETVVTGSVRELCRAAADACGQLGYRPTILTDRLCCQAREAGSFLASIAQYRADSESSEAYIAGGETVVKLLGNGLGGRNQELALAAAPGLSGLKNTILFSLGSDGTDGPTDAAGGIVDGATKSRLDELGISVYETLQRNDAYHALQQVDGLLLTGPTGTNVNDVAVLLLRR